MEPFSNKVEEQVQAYWKEKHVYQKAKAKRAGGEKYYFMDGPPYATSSIHLGTALNKVLKDMAIRAQRLQGKNVFDRAGYDTHGLPIENKVEQKLGLSDKKGIEGYGVQKFIDECRKFATENIETMNRQFENLGVWMDFDDAYVTCENYYIEAIWHTFKRASEKKLLYKGPYPIHACPRCETAVAYNEIEYEKKKDQSVYVKFKVQGQENAYLVIWTTTPWTLPANTGVMVHPDYDYLEAQLSNGEKWIIAQELAQGLFDAIETGYTKVRTLKGSALEGWRYENPLAKNLELDAKKTKDGYRVICAPRYVTLEAGTGLVHTAPGHGKEDFDAGRKAGLPTLSPVAIDGTMTEEAGKYAGKKALDANREIIADLEEMGALVYKHEYTHDYPFCWRCQSPLLMLSVPQWFLRISEIQQKLIADAKDVQWVPRWVQDRFVDWLNSIGDWPVSRARYWGAPLPIWECEKCGAQRVLGSAAELEREAKSGYEKDMDLHKPGIDNVKLGCACGEEMTRVPEVLDVWFDAGVSSWAALGYPASEEGIKEWWPAQLNIEARDQIRGWWNAEVICSEITFGKKPFEAVGMHGFCMDLDRKKMSKSRGNVITPEEVIEKHSRDEMRLYFARLLNGEDFGFDWERVKDARKMLTILHNAVNYYATYLAGQKGEQGKNALDAWMESRMQSVQKRVTDAYNRYDFADAAAAVDEFVVADISRTYIRLSRERNDKGALAHTLCRALERALLLLAPMAPHASDHYYRAMGGKEESVHLCDLDAPGETDQRIEDEMENVRELAEAALALREEKKKRLRWALRELVVVSKEPVVDRLSDVLAKAVNVKRVRVQHNAPMSGEFARKKLDKVELFLDTGSNGALEDEWELSELLRRIQDARKKAGLKPGQQATLVIDADDKDFVERHKEAIERATATRVQTGAVDGEKQRMVKRAFAVRIEKGD